MTELIVALDGSKPLRLMEMLWSEAKVDWYKLGPQALFDRNWSGILPFANAARARVFLDLKLADTADTVREAVKRFADAGIAAVSTFTEDATIAAAEGVQGTALKVWQVLNLSDDGFPHLTRMPVGCAHGAIVSGPLAENSGMHNRDKIVPGIRWGKLANGSNHRWMMDPSDCFKLGVTHAVVGRPIYQADDPVAAARQYMKALHVSPKT